MSEHEKVKQFHEAMGVPVASKPTMPDEAARLLRCRLLLEETLEFCEASGFMVSMHNCRISSENVRKQIVTFTPCFAISLERMAQENEDVVYIAMGNRGAMGTDVRVFDEVHRANMAKVGPDGARKDERGKVLKPDGWKPPDVARVLREMEEEP